MEVFMLPLGSQQTQSSVGIQADTAKILINKIQLTIVLFWGIYSWMVVRSYGCFFKSWIGWKWNTNIFGKVISCQWCKFIEFTISWWVSYRTICVEHDVIIAHLIIACWPASETIISKWTTHHFLLTCTRLKEKNVLKINNNTIEKKKSVYLRFKTERVLSSLFLFFTRCFETIRYGINLDWLKNGIVK